jgi:hypothetical protein
MITNGNSGASAFEVMGNGLYIQRDPGPGAYGLPNSPNFGVDW